MGYGASGTEGDGFSLCVMNEIRSRGAEDIVLLAVVDGLKAARRHPAVFAEALVRMFKKAMGFVSWKASRWYDSEGHRRARSMPRPPRKY